MSNFLYSLQCHMSDINDKITNLKWAIEDKASDLTRSAEKKVYKSIDYVIENPAKSAVIATTTVISASVAYVNAPAIAVAIAKTGALGKTATTGAVISKLTGAPLSRASLAKIGGGAISIGGKGVIGGKVVIATTAATTSAVTTTQLSKLNNQNK